MKLPPEWMEKLQACHQGRSQVLAVNQRRHLSPASKVIQEGDLILAVDSTPVCTFRDVEEAVGTSSKVDLTVLRDEEVKTVSVSTTLVDGVGTDRILLWGGMLLQCSYRAIQEMGKGASDIYCSYYLFGSPAHFYGMKSCRSRRRGWPLTSSPSPAPPDAPRPLTPPPQRPPTPDAP